MPTTYPAIAVCDVCCDAFIVAMQPCIPALDCLTRDCSLDTLAPGRSVVVPVHTSTGTVQKNPTNWESGDNAIGAVRVTPNQISVSFQLSNAQWQSGFRLEQMVRLNAANFAKAIIAEITPLFKWLAGPIPNPIVYPSNGSGFAGFYKAWNGATFTAEALKAIRGALGCCPQTCLWLGSKEYWGISYSTTGACCFVLTSQGGASAYGFSSISPNDVWTGADAAVRGVAFCPQALVLLTGLPAELPCGGAITSQVVTLPQLGLSVRVSTWCSLATRTAWVSYDVMMGVAVGDPTAAVLIAPGMTPPTNGVIVSSADAPEAVEQERAERERTERERLVTAKK